MSFGVQAGRVSFRLVASLILLSSLFAGWMMVFVHLLTRETWGYGILVYVAPIAVLMLLVMIFEPRFESNEFTWNELASKYESRDLPETNEIAKGYAVLGEDHYRLKTFVTDEGILVHNHLATSRESIVIPWRDISRIDRATITAVGPKPLELSQHIARIYLWRKVVSRAVLPWKPIFDAKIPTSAALNEIGETKIKLPR